MNDPTPANSQAQPEDEIDLREISRVLWDKKWLIGIITVLVSVVAVVVTLMTPNVYRAEALLAPSDSEATGGLSALAAQYGSLASLAGINLGDSSTDKTALGLEVLKSRKFLGEFVDRHDILVPLIAAESWDPDTGELSINSNDYDIVSRKWIRQPSAYKKTIPSSQEAHEEFLKILTVRQDKMTGFVTIAVDHYSPTLAKQWVDWLVEDLNSSIMRRDVAEAEQAIDYLNRQIESTSLAELQSVFFRLIEEQTKTVMLAKVTDEYLLKTLDPAVAPEKKIRPKRSLIVVLSAMVAFFLAVALVLVVTALRPKETR